MKRTIMIFTASCLLAGCSSSSLTVSETGAVTAVAKGSGFTDFRSIVSRMKEAITVACGTEKTSHKVTASEAFVAALDPNQQALAIPILERINANEEKIKKAQETLEGLLPSHSFTWNGKCEVPTSPRSQPVERSK